MYRHGTPQRYELIASGARYSRLQPPWSKNSGNNLCASAGVAAIHRLAVPFLAMAGYVLFAWYRSWSLAIASVMILSFATYGSTSHDLVHRTFVAAAIG